MTFCKCLNLFHNKVIEFVTNRTVCYCFKLQVVTQWLSVLAGSRKSLQHFIKYNGHITHLLFFQSSPSPPVCTARWGSGSLARCLQTGYWAGEWSELWTGGQTLVRPTQSVCNIIMDECEGYSTFFLQLYVSIFILQEWVIRFWCTVYEKCIIWTEKDRSLNKLICNK